jgi:hypothetical protein
MWMHMKMPLEIHLYIYWIFDKRLSWIPLLFILELITLSWENLFELSFSTIS